MFQRKLDEYFVLKPKPPPSGLSFLDLPYNVRYQIYGYARVMRTCPIDLTFQHEEENCSEIVDSLLDDPVSSEPLIPRDHCFNRRYDLETYCNDWDCCGWGCDTPLPHQLFYVSRLVHQEVSTLFYSQNHFKIRYDDPNAFRTLCTLTPQSTALITTLTIHLNYYSPCPPRDPFSCGCLHRCQRCTRYKAYGSCPRCLCSSNSPLSNISRHDKTVISEWAKLVKYIAPHITPSQLKLCLICDTADRATAETILAPLTHFPILSECSIRISRSPDRDLQRLLKATTLRLTGRSENAFRRPFPFTLLPTELQLRILTHTDLVAPADLDWDPGNGYTCHNSQQVPEGEDLYTYSPGPNPYTCLTCTGVLENRSWQSERKQLDPRSCTLSARCHCWRFPAPLFLVSRTVNQEAHRIFFSLNHFNILPHGGRDRLAQLYKTQTMSPFVMLLPSYAINRLRSLQFVFPYSCSFLAEPSLATAWHQSIRLLAAHADLPKLELTLDWSVGRKWPYYSEEMDLEAWRIWESYQNDVAPVMELGKAGLKDIWIHLAWPLHEYDTREKRQSKLRWERELEARVMGDKYDAEARGKWKAKGRWVEYRLE